MENLRSGSGTLDLAIVGGGPAGTAAALEASRYGLRIAIWDCHRYPRDKVCGEFISSEALPWLRREIPGTAARGVAIHRAEFISHRGLARALRMSAPSLGLSRRVLDAALWETANAAGVEVHQGEGIRKVRKLFPGCKQTGNWVIESATGSVRRPRALIIACGRWWAIEGLSSPARQNGSSRPGGWIGAKAHVNGVPSRGMVEMYFFHGGYCGIAPVEDGAHNVCCLVGGKRVREGGTKGLEDFTSWLVGISRHPALEKRLRGAVQVSPAVATAPVLLARGRAAENGALMAGDASGFLDPFTGEGISMALHSGRLAAQVIVRSLMEGLSDKQAAEIYGQGLAQAVRRSYKVAAMARALIHGPAWLHGLVMAPLPWIGARVVHETRWRNQRRDGRLSDIALKEI